MADSPKSCVAKSHANGQSAVGARISGLQLQGEEALAWVIAKAGRFSPRRNPIKIQLPVNKMMS